MIRIVFAFSLVCVNVESSEQHPTYGSSTTRQGNTGNVLPLPSYIQANHTRRDPRNVTNVTKGGITESGVNIPSKKKSDGDAAATRLEEFVKSLREGESSKEVENSYTNKSNKTINNLQWLKDTQTIIESKNIKININKSQDKKLESKNVAYETTENSTSKIQGKISVDKGLDKKLGGVDVNEDGPLEIYGTVDGHGASLWVQGHEVYSIHDQLREWAGEVRRFHAGVHIVVLHATTGHVLASQLFLTWQPAAHKMMANLLSTLQAGRIIVCIGVPDFYGWILGEGTEALDKLGAQLGMRTVKGEAWVMIGYTPSNPIYEMVISNKNGTAADAPPLAFSITLPRRPERQCPWYDLAGMSTKAEFCELYEGYGQFCDCHVPIHLTPHKAPELELEEVIPIALITARRLPMVARQVQQLWESPGGGKTPLVLMVDGYNEQAIMLANILNITIAIHNNSAPVGTKHRVNQHVKFSLSTIFSLFPDLDKAILLEDDLGLAPDFISYFQQTSILMSLDPTILCVNAYNYNSFPHTASDPSRIYRVEAYPYYGWMTSRAHASRLLSNWAALDMNADWDLYIRKFHVDDQHEIIIPEIPRTRHLGGAGVHVSGMSQETTYNQRPLNNHPNPTITLTRQWHLAYSVDLMRSILNARVVNITKHPCVESPIPRYQNRTHVIYIAVGGESDKEYSYKVLGKCMGFYHQEMFEHYRGTHSFKYYQTPVVLVACYSSVYCDERYVNKAIIYNATINDMTYAKKHPWRHTNETSFVLWRVPPRSLWEEVNLYNMAGIEVVVNE